jgi:hypothetical protein
MIRETSCSLFTETADFPDSDINIILAIHSIMVNIFSHNILINDINLPFLSKIIRYFLNFYVFDDVYGIIARTPF